MAKNKLENLLFKSELFWDEASQAEQNQASKFSEQYKEFLNKAKIETEVVQESIKLAKQVGYKEVSLDPTSPRLHGASDKLGKNKKVFFVNRGKSVVLVDLGNKDLEKGANFLLAHTDSPRLDLKVRPLYEDGGIAYLKPHYYGGIKKYHWPAIPLEMRGSIILKNNQEVNINIGGKTNEPVFVISDLLPHLEKEKLEKPLKDAIDGEEMNIIVGSIPVKDKKAKERVKLAILEWLNKNYKIKEVDFVSADIRFVPAFEARDVGLDKSLVGGYGQDDRVCVYTSLQAFLQAKNKQSKILYLVDKEEVGSMGTTGAMSLWLENVLEYLLKQTNSELSVNDIFRKSSAISADVVAAFDPDYKNVFDEKNSIHLGKGVAIEKYLGYRGKALTVDAEPKFLREMMDLFEQKKVVWQTGHLGKIDQGGGGTVAVHLANRNLEVVDMGVALLNMHAPYELASKGDIFSAYKGYKAFLEK